MFQLRDVRSDSKEDDRRFHRERAYLNELERQPLEGEVELFK